MKEENLPVRNVLIWDKKIHGMGDLKRAYGSRYQSIIFSSQKDFRFNGKRPQDIVCVQRVNPNKLTHPNEKPVELMQILIQQCSKQGDTVLDLFMGSGSIGVAAVNKNRNFIGFELDENYFQIAKQRISAQLLIKASVMLAYFFILQYNKREERKKRKDGGNDMDNWTAFMMGMANQGKEMMVFDWDKAATLIKERKPECASAGLRNDWEWTGGTIYEDGEPVMDDYTYLASTWAVSELNMDGDIVECFRMEHEVPEWNSNTKWPQSALDILGA